MSYTYFPGQEDCGVDLPWSETLVGGEWYELKLYIKLNDPGTPLTTVPVFVFGSHLISVEGNLNCVPSHHCGTRCKQEAFNPW